jgi:hypothetical protein
MPSKNASNASALKKFTNRSRRTAEKVEEKMRSKEKKNFQDAIPTTAIRRKPKRRDEAPLKMPSGRLILHD